MTGRARPTGASLKDVAALAGVSVKTVSNVVNGYVHVAPTTRERVQRVLDDLNYRPNLAARNLRLRRSGVIALAVPEIGLPYFAELARHVIKAAEVHGWTVLVDQTDGVAEREQLVIDGIRGHLIDGLILSPVALDAAGIAARTDATPMVLLGERVYDGPADHVAIDNVTAARQAVEHLLGLGRRRVGVVGAQEGDRAGTARLRLRGAEQALSRAGARDDLVVPVAAFDRAEGARAVARLLEGGDPPDALFCFNDLLALGALRALHEAGLRVPQDVAVCGFDDVEDGRWSTPTLTTVAPDKAQIARVAVDHLAARLLRGEGHGPQETVAGHVLVERESTRGR
ncbi:LacI family DNA-binding transcriptional regulator [Vallicoccus soli]|uniref:LacI family DNA-binding transcriptional regulator n=1 Tax=Vallicoccus soli TaxID=2339232 RepID=UPI001C49A35A|nr:LacI family DNA-binding transcriptional regulator [Vallicoccus soli]